MTLMTNDLHDTRLVARQTICKMEPAGVKVCQSKYRLTSRTIENKETGVFDLFSKSSSYPIILGRDRLQI